MQLTNPKYQTVICLLWCTFCANCGVYSMVDVDNHRSVPPSLWWGHRCRVVVSTCMTAGFLHSLGLPVGHFSHVIVDEAGQATEPEALLSATLLSNTTGQVFIPPSSPPSSFVAASLPHQLVLAGDPHQLGPVLTSHHANSLGFSLSLMERVMSREPYLRDPAKYSDHGSYDPLMVGVASS